MTAQPQRAAPRRRRQLPAPRRARPASRAAHPAEVLRVLDGDTFEARVHLWPGLDVTTRVRLRGIDAPELKARCMEERIKAEAARDALKAMLDQGEVGIMRVHARQVRRPRAGRRLDARHAGCRGGAARRRPRAPLWRRAARELVPLKTQARRRF